MGQRMSLKDQNKLLWQQLLELLIKEYGANATLEEVLVEKSMTE